MNQLYEDMIHLPHPTSPRHSRMSRTGRAAQFSPFAALTGHGAAIMETARITDQKVELTDDVKMELDQKQKILLEHIAEQPEITVTWFQADERKAGGEYVTSVGHLKRIDEVQRILCMTNGRKISLDDIIEIQTEWSRNDLFPG